MNIYRYKNCVTFNLWNHHLAWADCYPEIRMHALCIYNVLTREFRLFDSEDDAEIFVSENTRLHVIETIESRAAQNWSITNPTGVFDMAADHHLLPFVKRHYVGNPNARPIKLSNQREMDKAWEMAHPHPKVRRTRPPEIDTLYMLSVLSPSRRIPYLQRCKKISL